MTVLDEMDFRRLVLRALKILLLRSVKFPIGGQMDQTVADIEEALN